MCQLIKNRPEIKIDLVVYFNLCEIAKLIASNQYYVTINITSNSNDKNNNNYTNIKLVEFEIYTKILFIRETCYK